MFNNRKTGAVTCASIAAGLMLMGAPMAQADIIHVYEGESIQAAIDAAEDGDEIIVHPGTYYERITLRDKLILLHSLEGPEATIIDGQSGGVVVECPEDNFSTIEGLTITGGDAVEGGGISAWGTPTVRDCWFLENHATTYGGGVCFRHAGEPTLINCRFIRNTCDNQGGAMCNDASSPALLNCLFTGNSASTCGGAIVSYYSSAPVLVNCTLAGNSALVGGALFSQYYSTPTVVNSILWGNEPNQITDAVALTTVLYSDVEGGWWNVGIHVMDSNPLFVDPDNGDFRLQTGSPCIDAGANNALPADTFDLDEDGDTAERMPIDFDGNPRFADDPDSEDTGCGLPVIVDMGAYEYPGEAWHPMRIGDTDGDGDVDTVDLLALLAAWGGYGEECVLADLDLSGGVDTMDLLALLANWG